MLPYRYSALPLPEAGKYTRLLRLSPGDYSDDLHVELEQVLLDDTSKYEALSYVWGSTADPVPILVGSSRKRTISVTQNLATALQHLRDANEIRILWADAVCINQNDMKERSRQVTLMSDIYRGACQVVVWLGPEEDDSFHAFNAMHLIGSIIDVDWINLSFKPKVAVNDPSSGVLEGPRKYRLRDKEAHAVNCLLRRQWFERLWTRQEIGLATQAIICCGRLSMPWHLFKDAIFFIYSEGSSLMNGALGNQLESFIFHLTRVHKICQKRVYFFQRLRGDLAHVACADLRDKIYGVLSLLHPSQQNIGIVPDYNRDVALVYQDTTTRFINHARNLSILIQCELQDTPPHMPTWVPDWSTDLKAELINGSSDASANTESIATSEGEGMLSVAGAAAAMIEDVQPLHLRESEDDFQTILMALWKMVISNLAISNDIEIPQLSAMCEILCCGMFRHSTIPVRKNYPEFELVVQMLKSILTTNSPLLEDLDFISHWNRYEGFVRHMCHNRSFFVTTEGSVGLAPLSARPGDIVCVLLGCRSPILLRQTGPESYQVVGQSYMSGMNAGEALLGPLPKHLWPIHYYDEDAKGYKFAFWNERTENVQFQDPRLDKLLLNPGFQVHDRGHNNFPTIETSVEALRNAGIAAQYFNLV